MSADRTAAVDPLRKSATENNFWAIQTSVMTETIPPQKFQSVLYNEFEEESIMLAGRWLFVGSETEQEIHPKNKILDFPAPVTPACNTNQACAALLYLNGQRRKVMFSGMKFGGLRRSTSQGSDFKAKAHQSNKRRQRALKQLLSEQRVSTVPVVPAGGLHDKYIDSVQVGVFRYFSQLHVKCFMLNSANFIYSKLFCRNRHNKIKI